VIPRWGGPAAQRPGPGWTRPGLSTTAITHRMFFMDGRTSRTAPAHGVHIGGYGAQAPRCLLTVCDQSRLPRGSASVASTRPDCEKRQAQGWRFASSWEGCV
jgi:hypothetical protein